MLSDYPCKHGIPNYEDGIRGWGDCAECWPRVAYWRAWAGFWAWCVFGPRRNHD